MTDIDCRCLGKDGSCGCFETATQEDGLCDGCRWPDGGTCTGRTWDELDKHTQQVLGYRP